MKTVIAICKGEQKFYASLKQEGVNVSRALRNLKTKGLIFSAKNQNFELNDPLFEYWIRTKVLKLY